MTADVRIGADLEDVSLRAAAAAVDVIAAAARRDGGCSLVLSGGSTPRTLYEALASRFAPDVPWPQVHVFWGDERFVPHDDPRSNYRMAREALLDHVPCPRTNIHPIPSDRPDADTAAADYEATLREFFAGAPRPRFDLVLLGVGADGHIASLFPGSPALAETSRWACAVAAPADPPARVTLTWPALAGARHVFVLAAGASKAPALAHVLAADADPRRTPAVLVRSAEGAVVWWLDQAAAGAWR